MFELFKDARLEVQTVGESIEKVAKRTCLIPIPPEKTDPNTGEKTAQWYTMMRILHSLLSNHETELFHRYLLKIQFAYPNSRQMIEAAIGDQFPPCHFKVGKNKVERSIACTTSCGLQHWIFSEAHRDTVYC